jgi:hypothetical protein
MLYMTLYGETRFPEGCVGLGSGLSMATDFRMSFVDDVSLEDDEAIMFLSEPREGNNAIRHFSVAATGTRGEKDLVSKTRAIVIHNGPSSGAGGKWTCSRDKGVMTDCAHITRAKRHLNVIEADSPNPPGLSDLEEPDTGTKPLTGVGWLTLRNGD